MRLRHAVLRLAFVDGVSKGYKSGRKRCREIPDAASTAKTRSAGTIPRASQLETVLCLPRPKIRASAVCPPTALQASSNASLLMDGITAQIGSAVNADSGSGLLDHIRMGKKTILNPSPFWRRLAEALGEKWAPLNANSVATKLKMSQGSVHRWFTGQGLPELATALDLAKEGGVCVDWLLNNVKPKYPISKDPVLRELFETCEDLYPEGRERVLRAARGELLQQQTEGIDEQQKRTGSASRRNS